MIRKNSDNSIAQTAREKMVLWLQRSTLSNDLGIACRVLSIPSNTELSAPLTNEGQ
jgi:hypothetical protein